MNGPRAETPGKHPRRDAADAPVLPDRPSDEQDEAWGDHGRDTDRDRDWYERERPPHHE